MNKFVVLCLCATMSLGALAQPLANRVGMRSRTAKPYFYKANSKLKADNPTTEDLLGCPDGTVFGGEYREEEGSFTGFGSADQGRTDMSTRFYQHFTDCYYTFHGVRFLGLFNYYDSDAGEWRFCNDRGGINANGDMTKPIRFEISFYKVGPDGLPGQEVYKKQIDILGKNTGVAYDTATVYSFSADLGQTISMQEGYMQVSAVDMGDKPSCWFSVFTTTTSVGSSLILLNGKEWSSQLPMCFCFEGDGSFIAQKALKFSRVLSPQPSAKGKFETVQVEFSNIGANPVNDATFELWADGKKLSTEKVNTNIASLDTYKYTFKQRVDLSSTGKHTIEVKNVTPGDGLIAPDTISATTENKVAGQYAESKSDSHESGYITDVQMGSFDNPSEGESYSDFTMSNITLQQGDTLPLKVRVVGRPLVAAWIDWNNDGYFEENTDRILFNTDSTALVTVPTGRDIAPGEKRIRIVSSYGTPAAEGVYDYGETEDYTVNVTPRPDAPQLKDDKNEVVVEAAKGLQNVPLTITNEGQTTLTAAITPLYVLPSSPTADYNVRTAPVAPAKALKAAAPKAADPDKDTQTQYVLRYDKGQYDVVGISNYDKATYATMYPGDMLSAIAGMQIGSVDVFIGDAPKQAAVVVYGQNTQTHNGNEVARKAFTPQAFAWNHVQLDKPLPIANTDLWVGVEMQGVTTGQHNIGIDQGTAINGFGDLANIGGDTWWSMNDLGINANFCIRANVVGTPTPAISWLKADKDNMSVEPGQSQTVNLTIDPAKVQATGDFYQANVQISSNDSLRNVVVLPVYLTPDATMGIVNTVQGPVGLTVAANSMAVTATRTIASVAVVDMSGRTVLQQPVNAKSATVPTAGVAKGAYVVVVYYADGTHTTVKANFK